MAVLIVVLICVLGYFYLISPGLKKKPEDAALRKKLYAHRGLHNNETEAPENSLAAFKKAVDAGYGIELDIQFTKDKKVVVFHDYTLKRICNAEGRVDDYTYEELQQFRLCNSEERIPLFTDVLKLVDGKVPLIIEYKIEGTNVDLCPVGDSILKEYKGLYCVESFNPMAVIWYRKNRPDIVRGQLADCFITEGEYKGPLYFLLHHLLFNHAARPDFVAFNRKYPKAVSRSLVRKLYSNTAAAWTVKSSEQLEEAKKYFDIYIFDSFVPEEGPDL